MTEIRTGDEPSRILSPDQSASLYQDILTTIDSEPWKDAAYANKPAVERLVKNGIDTINNLEKAAHQRHPEVNSDTDVIYIDSGPGPYSYNMLEAGKTDLDDVSYHKWSWSRRMDRARIRTAYKIAELVTAKRIEEQTGIKKDTRDLTPEDFEQYGPYLMYASVDWQQSHINNAKELARQSGTFKIPDSKIISYTNFVNHDGIEKPIVHTEDQMEGLHFPPFENGNFPRRIVMVSHPAHFLRLLHILGKYPTSIPTESVLQLFPTSTPKNAGTEYTTAEIMGTLATIFRKQRASLEPFTRYEV